MAEWHLTPDYIVNNWTEEFLELMVDKLLKRKKREIEGLQGPQRNISINNTVSDEALFKSLGNKLKVIKK